MIRPEGAWGNAWGTARSGRGKKSGELGHNATRRRGGAKVPGAGRRSVRNALELRLAKELRESLQREAAMAQVLGVINSSPSDLKPVFDTMLEKAIELWAAKFGTLFLADGNGFMVVADRNLPPAYAQVVRGKSFSAEMNT